MIAIIDYGAGNLRSVQNTLDEIGACYRLVRTPTELEGAPKIVLPGVGHFGQMIRSLDQMGLREPILDHVGGGTPFLGICLGLQGLFEESEEAPELRGFGLMKGCVRRFDRSMRVPHMGWNEIVPRGPTALLHDLGDKPYVYFANSYYCPMTEASSAYCEYGGVSFTAVLECRNIYGVQFHPEKSGPVGLRIVRNFVEL